MIIVHRNLWSAIVDYTNFTIKLAWIYSLQKSIRKQSSRTTIADHLETQAWERTSSDEKLGSRFFDTCLIVMVGKNNDTNTDLKYRHRPSSIAHHQLTLADTIRSNHGGNICYHQSLVESCISSFSILTDSSSKFTPVNSTTLRHV